MSKKIKAKEIAVITVIDPDSNLEVEVAIYKTEGGGMVGIDASFIETEEPIYCPFDKDMELDIE